MMKVVSLCRRRSRDTVEVLEALAQKARAGEIVGITLCYSTSQGDEDSLITGSYAASTDLAAAAALRLSIKLANARR
jgi:hypothetical protein